MAEVQTNFTAADMLGGAPKAAPKKAAPKPKVVAPEPTPTPEPEPVIVEAPVEETVVVEESSVEE